MKTTMDFCKQMGLLNPIEYGVNPKSLKNFNRNMKTFSLVMFGWPAEIMD